jgi:hypothetical protein
MVVRRVGISRAEEVDATETYEQMREKYKREKARDGFEKGTGGFRRSE